MGPSGTQVAFPATRFFGSRNFNSVSCPGLITVRIPDTCRMSITLEASTMTPSFTFVSGDRMAVVGLGLWKVPREICASLVQQAIRTGYRHLDCACDYGNE